MKRLTLILLITLIAASCEPGDEDGGAPEAEAPSWTAEVSELDSTTDKNVEVKIVGASEFAAWRGGQPIPPGATVRTPESVRASLSIPHKGTLTLNHSTVVELAEAGKLILTKGEAVLEYPPGEKDDVHVVLPHAEAILHGTKVAFVAGEKDSTITVTQGLVEVRHDGQSFEVRAGNEMVLREGEAPEVTFSPELGRRVGWSQLGERDVAEGLPEVPRGLGKLVGKTPGGESEHRLDLVKHRVDVKIQGNLAYTEITESFKNPVAQTLEGVYRFPLPPDARISRLALKVGNRVMEGEFLETARAERIWRDVIDTWRDPAMLKWKEGNTFELRIFPIDPHQTREVTIGYVQRLKPSSGGYTYTYPMPVDRAGLIPAKRFEFEAQLLGHDPTQTLEVSGYPAFVETGATKDDKAITKVRWSADDFVARGDMDLRFGRRDASGMRAYTYTKAGEDSYAVFVLRPDLPAQTEIKSRDFVIVMDRSMSRTGAALELQRKLVPRMIREMDPLDRVTVIACSERCDAVGPAELQSARISAADAVQDALVGMKADGATYPVEAVRVAAEVFRRRKDQSREAHLVYFTDGVASIGELRPGRIGEAVQRTLAPFNARMSVVDVGGNTDNLVLDALASGGRGRVVAVDPMLSMTGQALNILSDHYRNILERPTLSLPAGVTAELRLPTAIAAGDEIVVAARFNGAVNGELVLNGKMNGSDFALRYPVKLASSNAKGNKFVPGEWAAQRIASLELDPGDHHKEIVSLSTTYGVLSRYTTLLALESKEMMNEYGVKSRDRTQWTGDESAEDEGEAAAAETATPKRRKRKKGKRSSRPKAPSKKSKGRSRAVESSLDADSFGEAASEPRASGKSIDLSDGREKKDRQAKPQSFGPTGGSSKGGASSRSTSAPLRSRGYYRRPKRRVASIGVAADPTAWERKNALKRRGQLRGDPTNRSKRMRYIRALVRASDVAGAFRETRDWLKTNPMDPEARVQLAQLEAVRGNIPSFYKSLVTAADAAPRGRWLQKRIHDAAAAQGDAALSCAMKVSLESTEKKPVKDPADILACPMMTAVGTWYGEAGAQPVSAVVDDSKMSGNIVVSLKSMGSDWDIMLIEPSGRPLWWGSSRKRLKVANVVGQARTERLALRSMKSGTYSVMAVPRDGKAGDVLEIEIRARGTSKTVHVTAPKTGGFEVAEITY